MPTEYLNENLFPGHLGYFFVVLSFGAAILSSIAYFFYTRRKEESWRRIGRISFLVHGGAVLGIFATLFYLIYTHQFQYHYVYAHSSKELPVYYIISCFWEGQEGSFLLWTFWHFVLGAILIRSARSWEGPVMLTLGLAQIMLASMLLGISELNIFGYVWHFGETFKLGSNPFVLLRNVMTDFPVLKQPDYMKFIQNGQIDGNGLNPLLQNYWMVIHPPVLFLGFAATIVPFAFAMGGLWTRRFGDWVRPALPWTIFGCMILGTGILMGGAWAYEALSFGGFWAWDPVENASLVPWLIFVAGLHTMLIFRARKSSLIISFILISLTFLLILYSTFLTRSGVLANTSVHSFTDLGLSGQLLIFMGLFVVLAIVSLVRVWKSLPRTEKEESTYSREFWMFIGSLVLSLAALHVIAITSIPVVNKINSLINGLLGTGLKTNYASPSDVIKAYHSLQIPFAIIVACLTGFAQYLKYVRTSSSEFFKKLLWAFLFSLPISLFTAYMNRPAAGFGAYFTEFPEMQYLLLLITGFFAIFGNADILFAQYRRKNLHLSGAAVAHIGFALILIGALISNARKQVISINTEKIQLFEDGTVKDQLENKLLLKNRPVMMGDYLVNYLGDSTSAKHTYYKVQYQRMDADMKEVKEAFTLHPYIIFDPKTEIRAFSPSTRHYLTKDIFTHLSSAAAKDDPKNQPDYSKVDSFVVSRGQTIRINDVDIKFDSLIVETAAEKGVTRYKLSARLQLKDTTSIATAMPATLLETSEGGGITNSYPEDAEMRDYGMIFRYLPIDPQHDRHKLIVFHGNRPAPDFITLKAIIFPFINVLWLGCLVMVVGFIMSMMRRNREVAA